MNLNIFQLLSFEVLQFSITVPYLKIKFYCFESTFHCFGSMFCLVKISMQQEIYRDVLQQRGQVAGEEAADARRVGDRPPRREHIGVHARLHRPVAKKSQEFAAQETI